MSQVRGLFATDNLEAGIKKLDVRDKIMELQPQATPFISILMKMNKKKAVDIEYSWFEDDLIANYSQINNGGGYTDSDTDLVVDDATIFEKYDIVKVLATDEVLLITAINDSTHTLTVTRGWGTTSAAAMDDNAYVYKLGNAQKEGYSVENALVTAKVKKSNYLQIFSKAVKLTETAENVDTYGGNRRNFERRKKAIEMKREIESQLIWGEPKEDLTGTEPRRQTGGIYYFLGSTAPSLDMSGSSLTESAFEGWLKDVFAYGEEERFLFCGPTVLSQISQFATAKQRMGPGKVIKYGVKVSEYLSANGTVNLVKDRHFVGPNAGKGICLDVKELVYRYLQNSDFKLQLNMQPNNAHYKLDEYTATIGLELHHALRHGILKGVA